MDFLILLFQVVPEAVADTHILDLLGIGSSPAALVYYWFSRRESKSKDAQIETWKAEADKYQKKWIEAVEGAAD